MKGKERLSVWGFVTSIFQRDPLGQGLMSVCNQLKRTRCRTRIFLSLALVVSAVVLLALFGTPYSHCVNYAPIYIKQAMDEQYAVLFPQAMEVTNSCPYCTDLTLSLPCYRAQLLYQTDQAFRPGAPVSVCDCECGTFDGAESTVDHQAPLNILFFTTKEHLQSSVSQHEMLYYLAAAALPHINAKLYGPGFPNFDEDKTLKENLKTAFPHVNFDIIFIQVASNYRFTSSVYAGLRELSEEMLVVFRFHECRYGLCEDHLSRSGAKVAIFAYARDLVQYRHHVDQTLLVHYPHVVHPPIYHNVSVQSPTRTTDVLFVGQIGADFPFGRRLYNMISEGKIAGARLLNPATDSASDGEKQFVEYIKTLESTKIALLTSSVERLMLMKYGEVAMSGALIVGDIPLGHQAEFKLGMVEVTEGMSDETILALLREYLQNHKKREAKVLKARQLYLSRYNTWNFFHHLREMVVLRKQGATGLLYPHYFVDEHLLERPSCTAYYLGKLAFDFRVLQHWFQQWF